MLENAFASSTLSKIAQVSLPLVLLNSRIFKLITVYLQKGLVLAYLKFRLNLNIYSEISIHNTVASV